MKLSSVAVPAALALLAKADVAQEDSPEFVPFDKSLLSSDSFFEQFDSDDWATLWKISKAKRDDEYTYNGEWAVEESYTFPNLKNEKGLVLKTAAAHHAIHAKLPQPFINTDKTLVLQYEVKLQEGLKCGGAYVKLLSQKGLPDSDNEFNNDTPYQVMFGPDKCGATNKVHFIMRRKDKNTGVYEEKHLAVPPLSRGVKTTTLYTLIVEPSQDFQIRINGDVVKAGNLLDAGVLKPGLNPPKEIDDPNDEKPEDWDEREFILDPNQTEKPEDWDEDAPYLIEDPDATKPETWEEDMPEYIPDPDAEKPEDWDDEEDGEYTVPIIMNPACEEHGCGPWEPPQIPNPAYKGKWKQPLIENPDYKGEWAPQKIANPDYYEDSHPSDLEAIGGIGFELWAMENNILFDNIYLGHSIEEAELIGNETFSPKHAIERKAAQDAKPSPKTDDVENGAKVNDDLEDIDFIDTYLRKLSAFGQDYQDWIAKFVEDPVATIKENPSDFGVYTAVGLALATLIIQIVSGLVGAVAGKPAPAPAPKESKKVAKITEIKEDAKEESKEESNGDVDADTTVASGVKKAQTSASKRT